MVATPMDHLADWFADATRWGDAILPDYFGGSVANIPATLLQAFQPGCPLPSGLLPPLRTDLVDYSALSAADTVVLLIIDGLSYQALQAALTRGFLDQCLYRLTTLTSVFPSTTSAALTSLHHGVAPSQHGLAGYTLFLPTQQRVVNMVRFKPVDGGAFRRPPPDPARIAPSTSLFTHLASLGIDAEVVSHDAFSTSSLTRLHCGNAPYRSHRTPTECMALLHHAALQPGRRLVVGYWAGVDMLAHVWGPDSDQTRLEIDLLGVALRRGLLEPLAGSRKRVAFLLTSDHGHCTLQPHRCVSIAGAMRAAGGLIHPPTGERRALGLSFRKPALGERVFRELAGEHGVLLAVEDAIQAGIYGPPPHHPELRERIGQYILLARGAAAFVNVDPQERESAYGAHGSLTSDEMLVPLLHIDFG